MRLAPEDRAPFPHEAAWERLVERIASETGVGRVRVDLVLKHAFEVFKDEAWQAGVVVLPKFITLRRKRRAASPHPDGGTVPEHDRISVRASRTWRTKL
jgi:hypothetical protein